MAKGKDDDGDMKELGSDATQAIGPLKKLVEDAFKTATMMAKNPNPKLAEELADKIDDLISEIGDLKKLQADIKKAAK